MQDRLPKINGVHWVHTLDTSLLACLQTNVNSWKLKVSHSLSEATSIVLHHQPGTCKILQKSLDQRDRERLDALHVLERMSISIEILCLAARNWHHQGATSLGWQVGQGNRRNSFHQQAGGGGFLKLPFSDVIFSRRSSKGHAADLEWQELVEITMDGGALSYC